MIGPNDTTNLQNQNFSNFNLIDAKLTGSNLSGTDLSGATLAGADLSGVNFAYAKLNGANLAAVDLTNTVLENSVLDGAILAGATLPQGDIPLDNVAGEFINSPLHVPTTHEFVMENPSEGQYVTYLRWLGSNSGGDSGEGPGDGSNDNTVDPDENPGDQPGDGPDGEPNQDPNPSKSYTTVQGTEAELYHIEGAPIQEVDYPGVIIGPNQNLQGIVFNTLHLANVNFSGANLDGAQIQNSLLNGADLSGANVNNLDLTGSNLNGANLSGLDLTNTVLDGAILENADLQGVTFPSYDINLGTDAGQFIGTPINLPITHTFEYTNLGPGNHQAKLVYQAPTPPTQDNSPPQNYYKKSGELVPIVKNNGTAITQNDLSVTIGPYDTTNLKGHVFSDFNLVDADLQGSDLENVNLSGANLSGANVSGTTFKHTNLDGANLTNVDFTSVQSFQFVILRYANLQGATLPSITIDLDTSNGQYIESPINVPSTHTFQYTDIGGGQHMAQLIYNDPGPSDPILSIQTPDIEQKRNSLSGGTQEQNEQNLEENLKNFMVSIMAEQNYKNKPKSERKDIIKQALKDGFNVKPDFKVDSDVLLDVLDVPEDVKTRARSGEGKIKVLSFNPQGTTPPDVSDSNGLYALLENINEIVEFKYHGNTIKITKTTVLEHTMEIVSTDIGATQAEFHNGNFIISDSSNPTLKVGDKSQTYYFGSAFGVNDQQSGDICFPAGTPVQTDQGEIAIEKLTSENTIDGVNVVAVVPVYNECDYLVKINKHALGPNYPKKTTLVSRNHRVFVDKKGSDKSVPALALYNGKTVTVVQREIHETIYNVLLPTYSKMRINGLVVETLHPKSVYARK